MNKQQLASFIVDRLEAERASIAVQWNRPEGTHTRHFYIDDLLPEKVAHAIYTSFPRDAEGFFDRDSFREKKRHSRTCRIAPQF
jgi:hypothetical protein